MNDAARRLFLVGCPRSGTTLLQAMLSAHSEICSFPETNFVNTVVGEYEQRVFGLAGSRWHQRVLRSRLRLALGLATRGSRRRFARIMHTLQRDDLGVIGGWGPLRIQRAVRLFIERLDQAALGAGYAGWLDKSPTYFAYLDYLEPAAAPAKFIHLVRPGTDVVASLADAARRFPGTFWEQQFGDPDLCIACWNRATQVAVAAGSRPHHCIVRFDELLARPEATLRRLSTAIGLTFEPRMLENYQAHASKLRTDGERWKDGTSQELAAREKFSRLFDAAERDRIRSALHALPQATI